MSNHLTRRQVLLGVPTALLLPAQRALASDTRLGIIFVGQGTCPYCQAIAPILADLGASGAYDVMLASMDGRTVPPFTRFEDGRAHPLTRDFRSVPQVMIYHPGHAQVTHVVGGVRNMRRFVLRLSHALRQAANL